MMALYKGKIRVCESHFIQTIPLEYKCTYHVHYVYTHTLGFFHSTNVAIIAGSETLSGRGEKLEEHAVALSEFSSSEELRLQLLTFRATKLL